VEQFSTTFAPIAHPPACEAFGHTSRSVYTTIAAAATAHTRHALSAAAISHRLCPASWVGGKLATSKQHFQLWAYISRQAIDATLLKSSPIIVFAESQRWFAMASEECETLYILLQERDNGIALGMISQGSGCFAGTSFAAACVTESTGTNRGSRWPRSSKAVAHPSSWPAIMYSVNAGLDAAKRKGVTVASTKDGRLQLSLSFAATLSWGKVAFVCSVMLVCLGYLAAPLFGVESMRRRVVQLEQRMSQKLSWVLRNKDKLKADLGHVGGAPALHADGRQHLLTPPGAMSKLAEAISPNTALADFDDHYLCGDRDVSEAEVTRKTIALAAISWMAPKSLRNSMESWRMNGLLDIADEKMIFLNSPTAEDRSIASEFGFDVYTTDERAGNVMAGPSLAYLAGNSTADYLLLLEKDFVLSAPRDVMMREMYTGVQHLARGVDAYRCAPFTTQWQRRAGVQLERQWMSPASVLPHSSVCNRCRRTRGTTAVMTVTGVGPPPPHTQ